MEFNFSTSSSSSFSSSNTWLLESTYTTFVFMFFSFSVSFSVFSLLLYIIRLKPCCNCDICQSYLTSSWSKEFDNLSDWYTHLLRKSPTATIHVHVLCCTITANRDNVEYMLTTKFDNYIKGKLYSVILGDFLGRGIFVVDGDSWKFQRKMASLELGSVSVRTYAFKTVMGEIESRLIPLLSSVTGKDEENGGVLDLQDVLRRFSFDNICKFSFGLDPGCLELSQPSSELDLAFNLASRLSAERALSASPLIWKTKKLLNLGSEKKLKEAIKLLDGLAEEMIRQKRKMGFSTQSDLLSRFMANTDDDRYLRDIVVSFLMAGRDTVSSGLTSFFWLLSNHPEVESAIREESDRVLLGSTTQEMASFEQLRAMHYLHAALYETMRILPPVQFDSKFVKDDDVLPDGTFVNKGSKVMYHPYAMGRMEQLWGPDCLEFKPERWLKDGVFIPENPFKYPVFQAGPRVCLGKEMAVLAMKSVALSLVHRFDIRMASPTLVPRFAPGLTASVKGGLPVLIRDRRD